MEILLPHSWKRGGSKWDPFPYYADPTTLDEKPKSILCIKCNKDIKTWRTPKNGINQTKPLLVIEGHPLNIRDLIRAAQREDINVNQAISLVLDGKTKEALELLGKTVFRHKESGITLVIHQNLLCQVVPLEAPIGRRITTPYYPQANGQVERFNRTLINSVSIYAESHEGSWFKYLNGLSWAYNTSLHTVTGFSLSKFNQSLWKQLKIKHTPSTARHQQTDGQSEVYIRTIKYALKSFPDYNAATWDTRLSCVEFALNDSISNATGFTPFILAYGSHPRTVISNHMAIPSQFKKQQDIATTIQSNLRIARLSIAKHQDEMVIAANKKRSLQPAYRIGDLVLLKRSGIKYPADSASSVKGLKCERFNT